MQERATKQKQVITDVLAQAERPLTVPELLSLGQNLLPKLGVATVYREINRLCESGKLHTVTIPGDPPRYEMAHHHHHHFKCTECDRVYELEGCSKGIESMVPKGFELQSHDITLYGLCSHCRA